MSQKTVQQFIDAINAHDLKQLSELMTDDHIFMDAHGNKVEGRDQVIAGWKLYFDLFPDYHIEAGKIFVDGEQLAATGFAEGTYKGIKEDDGKAHWKLPAAWSSNVRKGQLSLWQVFADSMIPFEIMNRYAPAAGGPGKVTGLGGIFFKSLDPKALCQWYDKHLGTSFGKNDYSVFNWRQADNKEHMGSTTLGAFKSTTTYFEPSAKEFMINLRVNDLDALLSRLRAEGVQVMDKTDNYDFGKFGWIIDPEGNKIELWEPQNEQG